MTVSAEAQTRTRHMWSLSHALCAARWALSRSRYVESLFRVSSGRWVRGTQEMCGKPLRPGQLVHSIGDQRTTWSRASLLNLAWLTNKNEVHDTGKVILFPAVILRRSYSVLVSGTAQRWMDHGLVHQAFNMLLIHQGDCRPSAGALHTAARYPIRTIAFRCRFRETCQPYAIVHVATRE